MRCRFVRRLFGTAGIRGRYPDEINPQLIAEVSASIATFFKARKCALGGDGRLTTPILKHSATVGLTSVGVDVIDVGLTPLPVLAWSTSKLNCDCGVYITASHNPPQYNGLKAFRGDGMELLEDDEVRVEEIYFSRSWSSVEWFKVGHVENVPYVVDEYVAELTSRLTPKEVKLKPKVLIDLANGAASLATPKVLEGLGAHVITLNANIDGRFPGRSPEPRSDVLKPFLPVAKSLGVDVFLAHDGDGDRLAVLSPNLGFIKQDRVIALLAKYVLSVRKGSVVVSIDVGNAVKDVVESLGGKLIVVKLGLTHEGLVKHGDVVMTAEPWKFIDPSWGPWVDGIYKASLIVKLMIEEGKNIDKLMEDIPNYPQARISVEVPKHLREYVYEALQNKLLEGGRGISEVITIDGLRVNYLDGSWMLIRKSGTEPKIRIYGESLTFNELKKRVDDLIVVVDKVLKDRGVHEFKVEGEVLP